MLMTFLHPGMFFKIKTLHFIYVYTDIHQGLQMFGNTYIYIYYEYTSKPKKVVVSFEGTASSTKKPPFITYLRPQSDYELN